MIVIIKKYESLETITINDNSLIITATASLKNGISYLLKENEVVDIGNILKEFYAVWENPMMRFNHMVYLSEYIRELSHHNKYSEEVIHGIKRNQGDILNSIYLLTESNIFPEDIKAINKSEQIFKELFQKMNLLDSFIQFRNTFFSEMSETNSFFKKLEELVSVKKFTKTIHLIGFYFITPIQKYFFYLLEKNGFSLVFYERHRINNNFSNEIYEKYLEISSWKGTYKNEVLESTRVDKMFNIKNTVDFIEFNTIYDFIEYIDKRKSQERFISTNKKSLDEILKKYFSGLYEDRHFLHYPIGQYLYYLYRSWDEYVGNYQISMDMIKACFASGWLIKSNINAKDLLYDLEKISPFFEGVKKIDVYNERLKKLRSIYNDILPLFTNLTSDNKYLKIIENPLLNFSVFSLSIEKLNLIDDFIQLIIQDSQKIFGNNSSKTLVEHFETLEEIIRNRLDNQVLLTKEKEIVEELRKKLDFKGVKTMIDNCLPEDFSKGIMLFLSGSLEENKSLKKPMKTNELVTNFELVEGLSITSDDIIHLTLADHMNLPGKNSTYPWPLTESMFNNLNLDNKRKLSEELINHTKFILNNKTIEKRLLFDIFLSGNYKKRISYIKSFNDSNRLKSPYLDVIEDEYNDISLKRLELEKKEKKNKEYIQLENFINKKSIESFEIDYLMREYELCPIRHIFSFILSDFPTYMSSFHYQFSIPGLISSIVKATGDFPIKIKNEVRQLFPIFNDSQWEEIMRYTSLKNNLDEDNFRVKNRLYRSIYTKIHWPEKERNKEIANKCKYCFHQAICKSYLLYQDDEKEI